MFFCMAACNPSASVCPSWRQPHRASIYAWEGSSVCKVSECTCVWLHCQTLMVIHDCVIYTDMTKNIPTRFDTQGFELWTQKGSVEEKPKHFKIQTRRHTGSLMFLCIQKIHLFQTALSWIQCACQGRSWILPHKRTIPCNYTPLWHVTVKGMEASHIFTLKLSTLRCVPLAALTNMLSRVWKTNYAVTYIPSRKVRLIRETNKTLPTAVAYAQTRVMSYNMLSSVLRNGVKWITYHRAFSNLC